MAEIKKDLAYYWDHEDEYPRMTIDDLKFEPAVLLCEIVLSGIREEMESTIVTVNAAPKDEEIRRKAGSMLRDLESPYMNGITFGHSKDLVDEFIRRCPKGVFDNNANGEKNVGVERKKRNKLKTNVNPIRYKHIVTRFN